MQTQWFTSKVISHLFSRFPDGSLVFTRIDGNTVHMLSGSGARAQMITLNEARFHLEAIRNAEGKVIFHQDQEHVEHNYLLAAAPYEA